jgi:hypothetical protein
MNDMSYNVYFRTAGMIAPALLFIYPGMLLGDVEGASIFTRAAAITFACAAGVTVWTLLILVPIALLRLPRVLRGSSAEAKIARATHNLVLLSGASAAGWLALLAAIVVF